MKENILQHACHFPRIMKNVVRILLTNQSLSLVRKLSLMFFGIQVKFSRYSH